MKSSLLAFLLILSILISDAQGVGLKKGFVSVEQHKIHEGDLIKTSNGGVGEVILCKEGHCSGNSRKLMAKTTSSISSTTTTSKVSSPNKRQLSFYNFSLKFINNFMSL
ncbi:hypothetical protein F0562_030274 [Nyssa sinensis]|uniref:Uncharacterized protein n=1 Tax=Nyssa sinensis TaxID=561372 RepID=A0A5J5B2A8_9ASTE|nr:hypothetical protein F0562_030274 [Nyssa sinensis]